MHGGWDGIGFPFWFGAITQLLFWALIILGIIFLVRRLSNAPSGGSAPPPTSRSFDEALRILEMRFAQGEIDEAEFRARRDTLRGG